MSDFLAIVHHLKTPLIKHESLFKETSLIKKKKKPYSNTICFGENQNVNVMIFHIDDELNTCVKKFATLMKHWTHLPAPILRCLSLFLL